MTFNLVLAVLLAGAGVAEAAPAATRHAPAPAPAPAAARIEQAERALETLDLNRVAVDRAYAEASLGHIAAVLPTVSHDPRRTAALQGTQALILSDLDRKAEAKSLLDRLIAGRHDNPDVYVIIFQVAGYLQDPVVMTRSIEGMARTFGNRDPGPVLDVLPPEVVYLIDAMLRTAGLEAERARLADALITLGWRRATPASLDHFRLFLVGHRLEEGKREEAARVAREIVSPTAIIRLLIGRRYDGMIADGETTLRLVLEEEDRGTASALAAAPDNVQIVLDRIDYLRSVGRNEEALALARPWVSDLPKVLANKEYGVWVVNRAASALVPLGRVDEAIAALRPVAELDMKAHPGVDLIGPSINYAGLLWEVGRPADSLEHIEKLRPAADEFANDYGKMWIAAHAACSHAALGQAERAAAELAKLRAKPSANEAALNQALLCTNDLGGSERLMIERLNSKDPNDALLALQDYRILSSGGSGLDPVRERLRAVRSRPAVAAAIERVGRILKLPLDITYHGTF